MTCTLESLINCRSRRKDEKIFDKYRSEKLTESTFGLVSKYWEFYYSSSVEAHFSCSPLSLCSSTICLIYKVSIAYSCTWRSFRTFSMNVSLFIHIYNSLYIVFWLLKTSDLSHRILPHSQQASPCLSASCCWASDSDERKGWSFN